ncbi:hypothetical protein BGZ94_003871 [Podila epigama]|nr:hypothetical protein BGZ94_003871 [Podila epigama]
MPLKVLIVGADVATLTLALLLELAGIDYLLLESQESVPVVASGIVLHPTVLPLLEQLSLRDDLIFFSQPLEQVDILDANMAHLGSYDYSQFQSRYGACSRFMTRPEYCDMVLNKLPESKVLFNKSVIDMTTLEAKYTTDNNNNDATMCDEDGRQDSILDNDDKGEKIAHSPALGVTCTCADGSVYTGHVLIGDINSGIEAMVDATPSRHHLSHAIRHSAQRRQKSDTGFFHSDSVGRTMTASDKNTSPVREIQYIVSGITESLDPQRIPLLREDTTQLRLVVDSKSSLSWWAATLVDNRIAWQVTKRLHLSEKSSLPDTAGLAYDDQTTAKILNQILPTMLCPLGGSMAQVVLWTSRFQTSSQHWDDQQVLTTTSSSRVLLLGKGCRKVIPLFGQAVDESILDALALSEVLFNLPSTDLEDIKTALGNYHKERSGRRQAVINEAHDLDQLLHSKKCFRSLYRTMVLNYTPEFIQNRRNDEKYAYRPQASFLSLVPDYGTVPPNKDSLSSFDREGGRRIPGRAKGWSS